MPQSYQNYFKKENQAHVRIILFFLLKDNLLNIHQRIILIYILYEISKNEKNESNTYIPIIFENFIITEKLEITRTLLTFKDKIQNHSYLFGLIPI